MRLKPAEYARARGVSRARVTQLVNSGQVAVDDEGYIDTGQADAVWQRRLETQQASSDTVLSYQEARARKELADARLKELKLEVENGRLIPRESVELAWFAILRSLRDAFLGLPDRTANSLQSCPDAHAIRELLLREILTVLSGLPDDPPGIPSIDESLEDGA